MLASLIIVFREVLEAGLITGVVLAATKGMPGRNRFVFGGIFAGILGACLVALSTRAIANAFSGNGQELLNAAILGTAVLMLSWHNIWMARHGRDLQKRAKELGRSAAQGDRPPIALAMVVGLAVLREGSEVVLFLYGIVVSGHETGWSIAAGSAAGLACGVLVTLLLYFGLVRIPLKYLFRTTGILIAMVAAGLASQMVSFLAQADVLSAGQRQMWNSAWLLDENSLMGRTLHVLVGYADRPTEAQLAAYVLVLATVLGLGRVVNGSSVPVRVAGAAQGNL
jgi:high-affinity iron transporter